MVTVRDGWLARLRLPIIAAPMFLVSGLDLARACCEGRIVGGFPAANARTPEQLDGWFDALEQQAAEDHSAAPYAVNLTLARNVEETPIGATVLRRKPPILISSVGDPSSMVARVHDWDGLIFHDVTTVRHAEKAVEAGVDGIILVCAGAGGHAGSVSPFALVPQVRERFDGLIVLAGAVSDGRSILAAQTLGADLVYMGTRFIATRESMASEQYRSTLLAAETKDIVYTPSISGLPASFIRQSIEAAGLDPAHLPPPLGLHRADLPEGVRAWRDILSAGQGAGLVRDVPPVAQLIDRLDGEYRAAKRDFLAGLDKALTTMPVGG
ncbi:MAG TPA: nitronate monooxygenase family protein [Caulobacteraceae bacterium]|nr:nitronate monooxygenase family protein [Caulobacteraceae bacterium]